MTMNFEVITDYERDCYDLYINGLWEESFSDEGKAWQAALRIEAEYEREVK